MYNLVTTNGNANSPLLKEFVCDSLSDISELPTSVDKGTQQGENTVSNYCCAVGSEAYVVEDSSTWVLAPDNEWHLKENEKASSINIDMSKYLAKDNMTEYEPTSDYNPATKKYVDDNKFSGDYNDLINTPKIPTTLPASDVSDWAKQPEKPSYTAEEVGADDRGSAASAETNAKKYTDDVIKQLIGTSPENLDTIEELGSAITDNQDAIGIIEAAITSKVDKIEGKGLSSIDVTSDMVDTWNAKSNFSGSYSDLTDTPLSLPASDVFDWAKSKTKPVYTAEEIHALPDTTTIPIVSNDLTNELKDTYDNAVLQAHTHSNKNILDGITSEKISGWDNKSDFNGDYNSLENKPIIPEVDVTLSIENDAADSKVTGEKLQTLDDSKVDKKVLLSILNNKPSVDTFDEFLELQRNDKIYQVKIPKSASNPTQVCEKLGANEGLVFEPSTDTIEGQDDYADKIEFMWWHNNYVRGDDTYPIITALEDDENYAEIGSVDVGSCGMSFYYKWDNSNEDYVMLSWSPSPHPELGLIPFSANVPGHSYWCLSAYPSIIASDGLLRSQPNGKMERLQSHNNMITNYQKKGAGYWGAGAERNTFQIIFNLLMGATKSSQNLYAGVSNWNIQFDAAVERDTEETYFPVTEAQAKNLEVGCYVSVGYASKTTTDGVDSLNKDRGVTTMHSYADDVKILRIEDMDDGNKAVYLDIDTGFTTTPVALTDELSSPIIMSSMHMHTGETDKVIGKHNGSAVSNTSGRHSYRVQGVEYALGAYIIASDTVMDFQSDYSKNVYIAPKGIAHSSNDTTIRNTYTLIGNVPASLDGNGADYWIGDITVDPATGAWYPTSECSSSVQGMGDRLYAGGTNTSGTREYPQGGLLWYGLASGSSFLHCWSELSWTYWCYCGCD